MPTVDARELEAKVKDMYREVATNPHGEFHFEMGRTMAERLGYSTVSNLVRAFRRWTGMTPAAYRREASGGLSVHLPLRR